MVWFIHTFILLIIPSLCVCVCVYALIVYVCECVECEGYEYGWENKHLVPDGIFFKHLWPLEIAQTHPLIPQQYPLGPSHVWIHIWSRIVRKMRVRRRRCFCCCFYRYCAFPEVFSLSLTQSVSLYLFFFSFPYTRTLNIIFLPSKHLASSNNIVYI